MSTAALLVACCLVFLCAQADGKRVMVIPMPYTSHTKYQTNIARAVAKLGHEVWVAIPLYLAEKGYLDTSGFHSVHYDTIPDMEQRAMNSTRVIFFEGQDATDLTEFLLLSYEHLDSVLRNDSFLATVRAIDPDLVVIDNLPMLYMLTIIPYRLGKPFAFVGSSYYPISQRVPFSPATEPFVLLPFNNKMTFPQRLLNTYLYVHFYFFNPTQQQDAVATYAPEMPYVPLDMLVARAEIWLVEMDHILDYPKPSLPNVRLIGGTATGPAKPLPPKYKSFMDSAEEGVIIVTFGSYVLDVPKNISDKLFNVFQRLPMKTIFRTTLASPDPSKILTAPWVPQNDLLGHPNTKVFVSHCGKNGQYEALYHAVPVVATPIFLDQPYNAERMRVKGFCEIVDLRTVSAQELTATILQVAREPRYKQAITKASRIFRQLYGVPHDEAARWLDHVMEYGGEYMRSASQVMPYYQFLLLDVIGLCLLVFHVVILTCFCLARKCYKMFRSKKKVD